MQSVLVILIIYLINSSLALCQNLSGEWSGGLPQDDKSWVFTMQTSIKQVGNKISGTSKYTSIDNAWVIEKFNGIINDKQITITETEVVSCTRGWEWCLKTLTGVLKTSLDENDYVIEGTWTSNRLYNGSNYYNGYCAPGKFKIIKPIPAKSEVKPATISGQVFDKQTLKPVKSTLTVIGDKSPKQTISTLNDGTYNFKTPINDISIISIIEAGYEPLRESVSIDKSNLTKNFFLIPKPRIVQPAKPIDEPMRNEPVVLKNVLFKLSTATLLAESFSELDRLANLMRTKPSMKIRLEGHTDRIGDAANNQKLSQDRVVEVKHYLMRKGINETRITTKGYGDTKTICNPPCEANRRVEFVVIEQ